MDWQKLSVLTGNVEVMDVVAEVVTVGEDAAARAYGEREGQALEQPAGQRSKNYRLTA